MWVAGLTSLATCLTAASGLALLDVSACGIGPAGASALATALAAGAPLATVRLRGNAAGLEGAAALAQALARTATLEELDAGSNQARCCPHRQCRPGRCAVLMTWLPPVASQLTSELFSPIGNRCVLSVRRVTLQSW